MTGVLFLLAVVWQLIKTVYVCGDGGFWLDVPSQATTNDARSKGFTVGDRITAVSMRVPIQEEAGSSTVLGRQTPSTGDHRASAVERSFGKCQSQFQHFVSLLLPFV